MLLNALRSGTSLNVAFNEDGLSVTWLGIPANNMSSDNNPDLASLHSDELLSKVQVLPSNSYYRVNDLVRKWGYRWAHDRTVVMSRPEFNDTILKQYLSRILMKNSSTFWRQEEPDTDLGALSDILGSTKLEDAPLGTDIVVHWRAGDVLERGLSWLESQLSRTVRRVKLMRKRDCCQNTTRVVIVTAFAYQRCVAGQICTHSWSPSSRSIEINRIVLKKFLWALQEDNPDVAIDVWSSVNIDLDMAYMTRSKCFIRGSGGFSSLIGDLLDYRAECEI